MIRSSPMEWHFGYLPAGTAGLILSSAATRITLAATSEESYAWAYSYALTFAACLLLGAVHRIRLRPWHAEYTQGVKTFKITRNGVRSTGSLRIDRPMEEAQEVFLLGVATVESVKFDGRDGRMLHFRQGLSIRSWGEKFTAEFTEEGRGRVREADGQAIRQDHGPRLRPGEDHDL